MKKIAFISTNDYYGWGGSEELWYRTAIWMASQGFEIFASVAAKKPEAEFKVLENANCTVIRRHYEQPLVQRALKKTASKLKLWQDKGFFQFLDRYRPDLTVISQGGNGDGLPWMEACQERGLPYALVSHAASEFLWPEDEKIRRLQIGYQQAKAAFFVSKNTLYLTTKQLVTGLKNAKVIRNPYRVPYNFQPTWSSPQVTGYKLALVGRLEPGHKGQDILFEVLRADKWRSRSLSVTLFGRGKNRESLETLKAMWELENISFGGFVNDVTEIWAKHHGLILPSRVEGLPISIVEAMLCARFCIVTDVAGNAELIQDNVNGFVAKAPKAECLDEAMERAWQQRDRWEEIGQLAAVSAREAIPEDPVAVFANEIKALL